jgi:hypothetical protein
MKQMDILIMLMLVYYLMVFTFGSILMFIGLGWLFGYWLFQLTKL